MIKRSLLLPLLLAAVGVQAQDQTPAASNASAEIAKAIVTSTCFGCHAGDDKSNVPQIPQQSPVQSPALAGQHAEYIYKQLRDYKSLNNQPAARTSADMNVWAAMLPDDSTVKAVAEFYAKQKPQPAETKNAVDSKVLELGQRIWRAGLASKNLPACAACHGPTGRGMPALYPALAGQFPEYTEAQMKAFRDGPRTNDPAKMMRDIAIKMTDPEIKAVSAFAASLRDSPR